MNEVWLSLLFFLLMTVGVAVIYTTVAVVVGRILERHGDPDDFDDGFIWPIIVPCLIVQGLWFVVRRTFVRRGINMQTINPSSLEIGRELDALVAEVVMGHNIGECRNLYWENGNLQCIPYYSFELFDAMKIVEKLAPLVGNFATGDGWFSVQYSEDDTSFQGCEIDDAESGENWSAHIHLGLIGANSGCPKHWHHGDQFCATGKTLPLAICRAALKAMTP